MIKRIRLFRTDCTDPYRNLAAEQCLLETAPEDSCTLYLWQNRHTVVIGRNQNAWRECRTAKLEADGGFLARRLSGGGAVFHDLGNLNFTFLVHKKDYDLSRQLGVIARACRALGIPAEPSGRNDLLADGRKFSGNAFYTHGGRSYHHGTLLVDADLSQMGRYLSPSRAKLESKGVASVPARVVNLRELRPELTIAGMEDALEAAFQEAYGLPAEQLAASALDEERVAALAARNAGWDWLYGQETACTLQCGDRFAWGDIELRLTVEGGTVVRASAYTDAMDWTLAPAVEEALTGCRFRLEDMAQRLCAAGLAAGAGEDLRCLLARQNL